MIELKNVTKSYPNGVHALNRVSLAIEDGEFYLYHRSYRIGKKYDY